jgi:hypothetical protein
VMEWGGMDLVVTADRSVGEGFDIEEIYFSRGVILVLLLLFVGISFTHENARTSTSGSLRAIARAHASPCIHASTHVYTSACAHATTQAHADIHTDARPHTHCGTLYPRFPSVLSSTTTLSLPMPKSSTACQSAISFLKPASAPAPQGPAFTPFS